MLHAEGVSLEAIADTVGTPVYVYSRAHFENRYQTLLDAMAPLDVVICYAVKANSNLGVLRVFAELGAGFDIVSGGELQRVISIGAEPERVVFSGVGKSVAEIDLALKLNIGCFNVESAAELDRIATRAELLARVAPISVRINPDVGAGHHPHVITGGPDSKFGIYHTATAEIQQLLHRHKLRLTGIHSHIGTGILETGQMLEAMELRFQDLSLIK